MAYVCFTTIATLTVDDHDLLGGLLLGEGVEDEVDSLAEHDPVRADLLRGANVEVGNQVGLDVVEDVRRHLLGVAASRKVLESALDGDDIVTVGAALDVRNLGTAW